MFEDQCDYCFDSEAKKLLPIGVTEHEGKRVPLVSLWCGRMDVCRPTDEVDLEALQMLVEYAR